MCLFLGSLPHELSKLTRLEYLDLNHSYPGHLTGEFPLEVARLPFLRYININSHSFSSNILKRNGINDF